MIPQHIWWFSIGICLSGRPSTRKCPATCILQFCVVTLRASCSWLMMPWYIWFCWFGICIPTLLHATWYLVSTSYLTSLCSSYYVVTSEPLAPDWWRLGTSGSTDATSHQDELFYLQMQFIPLTYGTHSHHCQKTFPDGSGIKKHMKWFRHSFIRFCFQIIIIII